MTYNKQPLNFRPPDLEIKNCVSVLISADFLKIPRLIDECAVYLCSHISEILNLPIDMNCINERLIKVIASRIRVEDLDHMVDKKDKL